jgi:hypothetical protein
MCTFLGVGWMYLFCLVFLENLNFLAYCLLLSLENSWPLSCQIFFLPLSFWDPKDTHIIVFDIAVYLLDTLPLSPTIFSFFLFWFA